MKKIMVAMVALTLVAGLARAEFQPPTAEQLAAAAENPGTIGGLLKDATPGQASVVLLVVVRRVQQLDIPIVEKKDKVRMLFAGVQKAMGDGAVIVISDVVSRMNPDLMPTVGAPGAAVVAQPGLPIALPLAPPIELDVPEAPPVAERYTGQ